MKRLPEGVSARSISLQSNSSFTQITIKNGFLWGKNENHHFVHVNLNDRTNVVVNEYADIGEIDFYSVSPNGEMCYVKTTSKKDCDYIFFFDKSYSQIHPPPHCIARVATWASFKNRSKPYLFLAVDGSMESSGIQLCYFNFNSQVIACTILMLKTSIPGKIIAFSLYQYDNQKIGFSFIIYDEKSPCKYRLFPLIFKDETFSSPDPDQSFTGLINFTTKNLYFIENKYIGISSPSEFYTILLNSKKNVSVYNIHLETFKFDINPKANRIFISNYFIFQFINNELSFFLMSKNRYGQAIDHIQLYEDKIFEVDTYSSNIYSISKDNVITSYQFSSNIVATGFDSFRFWLYFRLIKEQTKQSLSSAAIILLQSNASLDEKFNLARHQSDSFRLEVYMKLLNTINETHPAQRTVIAALALDIYVRKETMDSVYNEDDELRNEKMKKFIEWSKLMVTKKILTPSIIEKTLILYNWNDALNVFLQPYAAFELNMQLGQYDEARKQLKQIPQSNVFGYSALRLHSLVPGNAVYKDVKERDVTDESLIPLMENENYIDHFKQLFSSGRLTSHWLRSIFCLYMAKSPDTFYINQYFKDFNTDSEIMIRSLLGSKRYSEVACGICSQENYLNQLPLAVSIMSKVSAQKALELIPDDAPLPLQRRCALKVLRSMKRKDAEIVAKESLLDSISEIDPATLIEYMPETTTIDELSKAIKRYANRNLEIEKEEEMKSKDALGGIKCSNKLIEMKEPQNVQLFKFSTCCFCGRPLLNAPSVVYPCMHALHVQCALKVFNDILFVNPYYPPKNDTTANNNNCVNNNINSSSSFDLTGNSPLQIDLTADCPLCGFLCVKMINEPFELNRNPSDDEWRVDQYIVGSFEKKTSLKKENTSLKF